MAANLGLSSNVNDKSKGEELDKISSGISLPEFQSKHSSLNLHKLPVSNDLTRVASDILSLFNEKINK
ncbi:hypothetical protein, partial [Staphylococcus aureus]